MSLKRADVSDELLHAWVDGEAGARAADMRDLVENDPQIAAKAEGIRRLGRDMNAMVDAELEAEPADTLAALAGIRKRVAEAKARTLSARLSAWWDDVLLFHRKALAGVAIAAGLGALSAPGAVYLMRDRVLPQGGNGVVATSVTVESLEVGESGKATVLHDDSGNTTLIWVDPGTAEKPLEF
jgi:anti-sigma factor RsiW